MDHYEITTKPTGRYIRLEKRYEKGVIVRYGDARIKLESFISDKANGYAELLNSKPAAAREVTDVEGDRIMNDDESRTFLSYDEVTPFTPDGKYHTADIDADKNNDTSTVSVDDGLTIAVKYFSDVIRMEKIAKGDWIDLRSGIDISLRKGEAAVIPLGVGMKLPEGYEAWLAPRSSTYKNFGIIQTNSIGIIDNSYSGDEDEWKMPVIAMRDTEIHKNDRICQFRIVRSMPAVNIKTVDHLDENSRGGYGSTGKN